MRRATDGMRMYDSIPMTRNHHTAHARRWFILLLLACGRTPRAHASPQSAFSWPADCAAVRANNSRALVIFNVDKVRIIPVLEALAEGGWDLGVVHKRCHDLSLPRLCLVDTPAISFVRTHDSIDRHDLLAAILAFQPALVVAGNELTSLVRYAAQRSARVGVQSHRSIDGALRRAVDVLRCSSPLEHYWPALESKSSQLSLAKRLGVPTPWTVHVPRSGLSGAALERLAARSPLVIKTDSDGASRGVHKCYDAACTTHRLRALARDKRLVTVQEFVRGPTLTYDTVAIDGHLLGGVARATVLTGRSSGVAQLSRTLDCPQAADAMRILLSHIGFTGVAGADFVVDAASGRVLMIDPNLRFGAGQLIDGEAMGIGESLYGRLRRALTGETPRVYWPVPGPPAHSIAYVRFQEVKAEVLLDFYFCPDIYVPIPWRMAHLLASISRGLLEVDGSSCRMRDTRVPTAWIHNMCTRPGGPCQGRCRPLAKLTPALTVADLLRPGGACDPGSDWARAHTRCRARAALGSGHGRADGSDGGGSAIGISSRFQASENETRPPSLLAHGLAMCAGWTPLGPQGHHQTSPSIIGGGNTEHEVKDRRRAANAVRLDGYDIATGR